MKQFLTVLTLITCIGLSPAKAELSDCEAKMSVYYEYYKNKNYADALKPWSYVFRTCPEARQAIYIHGPRIVEDKIKKAKDEAVKEAYIDTLLLIYDMRLKYFPGKEGYVLGEKGIDVAKYRKDSLELAFELLGKSVEMEGNETKSAVITYYFQTSAKLYNAKKLDKSQMIDIYDLAAEIVAYNIENGEEKSKKYYEKASVNIEKIIEPFTNCKELTEIYGGRYEEKKDDAEWLARAAKMLDKKGCSDQEIYFNVASRLYEINPSAEAAANLGAMALSKNQLSKAIQYYQEAAESATDDKLKGTAYYGMAAAQSKQKAYASAKASALKAAAARPNWGEPYLLIGSMYAEDAGRCGSNDFERRAVYWVAIDKFKKAKSVDPSVAARADKLIAAYQARVPDNTTIFTANKKSGDVYKVECWINESVTIPAL